MKILLFKLHWCTCMVSAYYKQFHKLQDLAAPAQDRIPKKLYLWKTKTWSTKDISREVIHKDIRINWTWDGLYI